MHDIHASEFGCTAFFDFRIKYLAYFILINKYLTRSYIPALNDTILNFMTLCFKLSQFQLG